MPHLSGDPWPPAIETEAQLEDVLARPSEETCQAMRALEGDLLVLGAGGKMGPSLLRLARRSADAAGLTAQRVIAVSRFSQPALRETLQDEGIETLALDLLDPQARGQLPAAPNVLLMLGHKFGGTQSRPGIYWAMNTWLPGVLAEQFRGARIVCFSSGNVYPFTPVGGPPPTEEVVPAPVGEYALTVWGRERMLQWISARYETPVCLLRLNYAIDLRYGVLVDLALKIVTGGEIDLAVPLVNVIWQGDANAVALRSFALCASPADILNVTGMPVLPVRHLAEELGRRLGTPPKFAGSEGDSALVSDATRCLRLFGPPKVDLPQMLDWVAHWVRRGGHLLGKPTGFQVRDGQF